MYLYIVRHGETDLNRQGRLQGWIDQPLNANGRQLALMTGEGLRHVRFDRIFTSPLGRAMETAELVTEPSRILHGQDGIPVETDDRLKEIRWGEWDACICTKEHFEVPDPEKYRLFYSDPFRFTGAPGGESTQDVCDRALAFMKEMLVRADSEDGNILVSTHGATVRALLHPVYREPDDFWHGSVPPNCSVNVVEIRRGKMRLLKEDQIFYDPEEIVNPYQ